MRHDDQRKRLAGAILLTLLTVAAASAATLDRRLVEAAGFSTVVAHGNTFGA